MQKHLLIAIALAFVADGVQAQNTTYGGAAAPFVSDGGYVSDYAAGGTVVLPDGSVTLSNNATYEHGNGLLQNDGSWTSANSLDLFLNPGNATISGSAAPEFYNVNFNTGVGSVMAITNTQGIQVAGQAQFNNGITTTVRSNTNAGAVRFSAGATYTGAGTDAQHIDGYVAKSGTDAFTFPVGSGTDIRTLSISAPATAATQIATAWFEGSPTTVTDPSDGTTHDAATLATPLQAICNIGFWDWQRVAGTTDGISITVSMPDMTSFAAPADLRLAGWNGTQWIDLSGTANAPGNTEGSTLSGTLPAGNTITAITIGSISSPLPVTFSAFEVQARGCKVFIRWSTAEEKNNDHFLVERSRDGRSFMETGNVAGAGNSTATQQYNFTDEHPVDGLNYYRVRQVDKDGQSNSTAVQSVYVHCNGDAAIKVFPTVSNNSIQVLLPAGYEEATVELLTTLGQKVNVPIDRSNLSYRIRVDQLASAMYIVRIRKGTELYHYKVIREN